MSVSPTPSFSTILPSSLNSPASKLLPYVYYFPHDSWQWYLSGLLYLSLLLVTITFLIYLWLLSPFSYSYYEQHPRFTFFFVFYLPVTLTDKSIHFFLTPSLPKHLYLPILSLLPNSLSFPLFSPSYTSPNIFIHALFSHCFSPSPAHPRTGLMGEDT